MNLPELTVADYLAKRYSAHSFVVASPADKVLGYQSLPPDWFGVVRRGIALRQVVDPDTYDYKTVGSHFPGDFIMPEALLRALESYEPLPKNPKSSRYSTDRSAPEDSTGFQEQLVYTLTRLEVVAFDANTLVRLMRVDAAAAAAFARLLALAISQHFQREFYDSGTVSQRVAWLLHRLQATEGEIAYSQDTLARALNTSRERVTETLRILKEEGVIEAIKDGRRSRIAITDLPRLEHIYQQNAIDALRAKKEGARQPLIPNMMDL